jgi:hypothetical protein
VAREINELAVRDELLRTAAPRSETVQIVAQSRKQGCTPSGIAQGSGMSAAILQYELPVPELRHQVNRVLQDVWEPPAQPVPNPDDAVLISAALELRRLMSRERILELQAIRTLGRMPVVSRSIEREANRLTSRRDRLSDFVLETKAAGLAGTRVKLHVLCDRMIGILDELEPAEAAAMRDIMRVIAREMTAGSRLKRRGQPARRHLPSRIRKVASPRQSQGTNPAQSE